MHSLTIVFGPTGTLVQFSYDEREKADKMLASIFNTTGHIVGVEDDYGQSATLVTSSVHGAFIEDLAKSGDSRILRSIQNAKDQVKLQNKAAADPALKFAASNGSMAMNHPGAPRRSMS